MFEALKKEANNEGVEAKQGYRHLIYVVRENDKNGRIIGVYAGRSLLMNVINDEKSNNAFVKANVQKWEETEQGRYLHKEVFLVQMYDAENMVLGFRQGRLRH